MTRNPVKIEIVYVREQVIPEEFKGWYFEHGSFCDPEGNRFGPLFIKASFFYMQMHEVKDLVYQRPEWADS